MLRLAESMPATAIQLNAHNPIIVEHRISLSQPSVKSLIYRNILCSCIDSHGRNKPLWSASEIAEAVNGRIIKWGPSGTISTDSRTLKPGQWFFALVGKNFNAHDFVSPELYGKGCVGVIGNHVCKKWEMGFIQVEGDTSTALQKMAKYARKRFNGRVVGITGSVGKTTTRTMITHALETIGSVYQTHGNQNNHIGVALSLIGIPGNVDTAVLELGMSSKGEILELAQMCRPSVRVLLNVEPSHLVNFGSLEEVARTKGEILLEANPGDICVLNADDPLVMNLPVPEGVKKVLFGRRIGCDVCLVQAESTNGGCGVRVKLESTTEQVEFVIPSPGMHLAINACAAAAVAVTFGVSMSELGESLSRFLPVHMRAKLEIAQNGIKIINDAYNANPTSTRAAIDLLKAMDCNGKRVAILGDMLELGPMEKEAHEIVLNLCCDAHLGLVVLIGKRFLAAAENLNLTRKINFMCTLEVEELSLKIAKRLSSSDIVLVKGSRGLQMEKAVAEIKAMHLDGSC